MTEPRGTDSRGAPLLRTEHLTRHFKIGGLFSRQVLHAVDDVNFGIDAPSMS